MIAAATIPILTCSTSTTFNPALLVTVESSFGTIAKENRGDTERRILSCGFPVSHNSWGWEGREASAQPTKPNGGV